MAEHNRLGTIGEEAAWLLLSEKGYRLLERNWVCGKKEIDIICQDHGYVVFVEVKTRREDSPYTPHMAMDRRKIYNLVVAANCYIHQTKSLLKARFDLVDVIRLKDGSLELKHIISAFHPPMMRQTYKSLNRRKH